MKSIPLCVDCDGTLLRTDLLYEAVFGLMKQSFFSLLLLPVWLFKGKAYLKAQLAARVKIDAALLPYHDPLLDYLRQARDSGRELVLATASHRIYAESIANHLGIFSRVEATDNNLNLSGRNKADRLVALYGEKGFEYAGNSRSDLAVWKWAAGAIVVQQDKDGLAGEASKLCPVSRTFSEERKRLSLILKAMRPHQWLKNLLVFLPLLAAHKITEAGIVIPAMLAFFAFGFCASSVYLLNDLLDLPADRAHPRKRYRPFASGALPVLYGAVLIPLLLGVALLLALWLPKAFLYVLVSYYVTTTAYSIWLKNRVVVDVFTLAGLYTIRIVAGAAATSIMPSFWLLAFSMFLFLSLAMVKRYSEMLVVLRQNKVSASGRGYHVDDLPVLMGMGVASGFLSVLVMALYMNSSDVHKLYPYPAILWLILPMLLFWVSRVWMKTHRGEMHDDPVIFAVRDSISLYSVGLAGLIAFVASGWSI